MQEDGRPKSVKPISRRRQNPFGMQPSCPQGVAVPGYGDPAADFQVIGDHPGRHGGGDTGIPFTNSSVGMRLQAVLHEVGLLASPYADEPEVANLFLDYIHMCGCPDGEDPTPASYQRLERYFDAEIRAVNAHILLPVGKRATDRIIGEYTTQLSKVPREMDARHTLEVRGRGFLVIPIKDPTHWQAHDREQLVSRLNQILDSDYRQTKGVATRIG